MDIIFVTETWIHDKADLQYIAANIQGLDYNITSTERQIEREEVLLAYTRRMWKYQNYPQTHTNLLKH